MQWGILGSEGTGSKSWDHVFLITAFVSRCAAKMHCDGVDTWGVIFGYITNSFNALAVGIFPNAPLEVGTGQWTLWTQRWHMESRGSSLQTAVMLVSFTQ